jgi:hypothetical protein
VRAVFFFRELECFPLVEEVDFFLAEDVVLVAALGCVFVLEAVVDSLAPATTMNAHTSANAQPARGKKPRIPAKSFAVNVEWSLLDPTCSKRSLRKKKAQPDQAL